MTATHLKIVPKRGKWLVEVNAGSYLGPYAYERALVTATALAEAAWQLGYDSCVDLEDRRGELHRIWTHPAQRHEIYV